jgi:hypothetical protein
MNAEIFAPKVAQFGNRKEVVLLEHWMSRTMKTTEIAANFERNDVHMLIPTSYKNSYGINGRFFWQTNEQSAKCQPHDVSRCFDVRMSCQRK